MANGDICHLEIGTTDLKASRDFYTSIFGWIVDDVPGMEGYALFRTPAGLGGGLNAGPDSEGPSAVGPVIHIEVEDIDETLKRIAEHGGETLVPNTPISEQFGAYAVFLDNVGNRMGLWSR